jgi:hypothetical protein
MQTRLRKLSVALAAMAILGVLTACMPKPPTGPPQGGATVERKIDGSAPAGHPISEFADCRGTGYVQRGANQTVPKLKLVLESPLLAFPVARDTEPNQFASRNVTTMSILLASSEPFATEPREYHITYWCTSDKDQAWTVFG